MERTSLPLTPYEHDKQDPLGMKESVFQTHPMFLYIHIITYRSTQAIYFYFFNVHMTFPEKQSPVAGTRDFISMALALDQTRMIPSLPYKLDRIMDFGLFIVMAIREAVKENVLHASAPHAPYVSTAKRVHRHPSSEHLASYLECLRTSAALAAVPAETPASNIVGGIKR